VTLPVRTTPEADEQIRSIDAWWRANRGASPELFAEELESSLDTIAHTPQIGRSYRRSPVAGTRRVLLKGSRYHVYYVPTPDGIDVIAVWHGRRGVGPPLRG
jgi:plasmid stabilization system protein ParE